MAGATVVVGSPDADVALRELGKQFNNAVTDLEALRAAIAVTVGEADLVNELRDDHATFKSAVNDLVARVNQYLTHKERYQVTSLLAAGLSIDAAAEDIETDNAITIYVNGHHYPIAAVAAIDVSTKTINGRTIATSRCDAGWVFVSPAGTVDMDQSIAAQTLCTSNITGLARYSMATTTLPPTAGMVPIGVVSVLEGGSGTFTWGTESIAAESETFYSFSGLPGIVSPAATFAATGGATATFAYGAGVLRLGTGTVVSYTGRTGVAFNTTNKTDVPTGNTGVWLLYVLSDDEDTAMQLGGAGYTTLALAQAAVRDHNANPLMPPIGVIYVQNASGSDFVPGTTNLNVAGLTNTFTIVGTGSSWLEMGRGVLGQPFTALTNDAPATISAAAASTPLTSTINEAADLAAANVTLVGG